jgi:cytosine/creatinine deaminase
MERRTLTLRRVRLTDDTTTDVEVDEDSGTIVRVGQDLGPSGPGRAIDLHGYLLLPAPAEPHAHLDKAFLAERIPNPSGDLPGAIVAMDANRASLTAADIAERAERAARMMVANGITAIRSHADTMTGHGLRSVEGLVAARERLAGLVDLQIVALVSWPVTGTAGAEHRALLEAALEAGADVVGGCPHLDDDPDGANEVLLEIAADHGCMVDLHTDETLNPCVLGLRDLAARVAKSGFPHQVAASHCVSLGVQPLGLQREVAAEVAAAGVGVVTLPQTNLYLQARDVPVAPPRGLTAIRPLLDAGATVAAGADNLQDPFNLVGRADPMETAALMVMAGHLLPAEAYEAVSTSSRALLGLPAVRIEPGAPAELLAIRADSLREAIATAPLDRLVIHAGRVVSRTRVTSDP